MNRSHSAEQTAADLSGHQWFEEWEIGAQVVVLSPVWAAQVVSSFLLIYVILYKHKQQFHTSGYILVSVLLLGEIIYTSTYLTCFVLAWLRRSAEVLQDWKHTPNAVLTMILQGTHQIILGLMTIISIQRVCCIVIPHRFATIFSIRNTLYSVVCLTGVILTWISVSAARGFHLMWDMDKMLYVTRERFNERAHNDYFGFMFIFIFGCGVVNVINYTIVLVKTAMRQMKKRKIKNSGNPNLNSQPVAVVNVKQQMYNRELMLTSQFALITVLYLIGMALVTLSMEFPQAVGGLNNSSIISNFLLIGNNCVDPFLYLIMNKGLRDCVKQLGTNIH